MTREEIADAVGAAISFVLFGGRAGDMALYVLGLAAILKRFRPKRLAVEGRFMVNILKENLTDVPEGPVITKFFEDPTFENLVPARHFIEESTLFNVKVASRSIHHWDSQPVETGKLFVTRTPFGGACIVSPSASMAAGYFNARVVIPTEFLMFLGMLKLRVLDHFCAKTTITTGDKSDEDWLWQIIAATNAHCDDMELTGYIESVSQDVYGLRQAMTVISRNVDPDVEPIDVEPLDVEPPKVAPPMTTHPTAAKSEHPNVQLSSEALLIPPIPRHVYPKRVRGVDGEEDAEDVGDPDDIPTTDAPLYSVVPLTIAVLRDAPNKTGMTREEVIETIGRVCPHYQLDSWSPWMLPGHASLLQVRNSSIGGRPIRCLLVLQIHW
ncbi:hypothetical protein DL93DRAFT_1841895 [Clavulina sp. PMI_390]|nr:hypothetical protein DL93DRAFT_1841895 [Clavulina sp. PMI_390]